MPRLTILIFAASIAMIGPAVAQTTIAGQASIIDGDTLEIQGQRIRLLDIDAPEAQQICQDWNGADYKCGQKAALVLSDWIGEHLVICATTKLDSYQRHLARCSVRGQDMASWLAGNGLGVPYRDCKCKAVRKAAERAELAKVGLWAGEFELPWEWRKAH